MRTVKVTNAITGETFTASARGKVMAEDIQLTEAQVDALIEKNMNAEVRPVPVAFDNRDNEAYYDSLPRFFNYDKKGRKVNNITRKEYDARMEKRFGKRGK